MSVLQERLGNTVEGETGVPSGRPGIHRGEVRIIVGGNSSIIVCVLWLFHRVCEDKSLEDLLKRYIHPTESNPVIRHR